MNHNEKACLWRKYTKPLFYVFAFCLVIVAAIYHQKIATKILGFDLIEDRLLEDIPDKIWLHRCDSEKRLATFHAKYSGVEIDVIYHDKLKVFESSHDPVDPNANDLETIFKYYATNNLSNKIWLDFKNLNLENSLESEKTLSKLIHKYAIKIEDVIVESKDWNALKHYKDKGYKTSYYFPYYPEEALNDTLTATTEDILKTGNIDYISFYYEYYNFIKELEIPDGIKLLTWIDGRYWYEIVYFDKFERILNDADIEVILTREKKHFR